MAIRARASANTRAMTMAVKIFGALEGFLPNAAMLVLPQAAKTQQGPKIATVKIRSNARFRSIKV